MSNCSIGIRFCNLKLMSRSLIDKFYYIIIFDFFYQKIPRWKFMYKCFDYQLQLCLNVYRQRDFDTNFFWSEVIRVIATQKTVPKSLKLPQNSQRRVFFWVIITSDPQKIIVGIIKGRSFLFQKCHRPSKGKFHFFFSVLRLGLASERG